MRLSEADIGSEQRIWSIISTSRMIVLIEIIGWIATIFRSWGMLAKSANSVKILVSIGNTGWLLSGILTRNTPLIASNAICLVIMLIDIIKEKWKRKSMQNESGYPSTR